MCCPDSSAAHTAAAPALLSCAKTFWGFDQFPPRIIAFFAVFHESQMCWLTRASPFEQSCATQGSRPNANATSFSTESIEHLKTCHFGFARRDSFAPARDLFRSTISQHRLRVIFSRRRAEPGNFCSSGPALARSRQSRRGIKAFTHCPEHISSGCLSRAPVRMRAATAERIPSF